MTMEQPPQLLDRDAIEFNKIVLDNWGNPPIPPIDDDDNGGGWHGDGDGEPFSLHQKICMAIAAGAFMICAFTAAWVYFVPFG